jgi:hypothetical protein
VLPYEDNLSKVRIIAELSNYFSTFTKSIDIGLIKTGTITTKDLTTFLDSKKTSEMDVSDMVVHSNTLSKFAKSKPI